MATTQPPFTIAAVHFGYPGSPGNIPLRIPETGEWIGETAEWTWTGGRRAAAFVGGTATRVMVRFRRLPGAGDPTGVWLIGARDRHGLGLRQRRVRLRFGRDGQSQAVAFRLVGRLPAGIGRQHLAWHWHAVREGVQGRLGVTRHVIYHTLRRPVRATDWATRAEVTDAPHGRPGLPWVYLPVMRWTCAWASGRRSDKAICDAVLEQLPRAGLKYAVAAWNVGQMLQAGGGYCGGWYRMFQAMAGAQGVRVVRRSYLVDWRVERHEVMRWCALVVEAPGLNRQRPVERGSTFHDADRGPGPHQPVRRVRARRYRFWGHPGQVADGHCVNFLRHRGRWYLYDASFRRRAVRLADFRLPAASTTRTIPVEQLGSFQAAYLDEAVGHLLGSLRHAGRFYRTTHPEPDHPECGGRRTRNGLTVRTAIIPPRARNITFYWTD